MNAIEFDKPHTIQFHGGRWDGMEIAMMLAPEIVHVDPNGQGVAKTDPNAPPLPPGWTTYFRIGPLASDPKAEVCYMVTNDAPGWTDFA